MASKNKNHHYSAFPLPEYYRDCGLTKREYFAGLAMQGILSKHGIGQYYDKVAEEAVKYADALLEELDKQIDNE